MRLCPAFLFSLVILFFSFTDGSSQITEDSSAESPDSLSILSPIACDKKRITEFDSTLSYEQVFNLFGLYFPERNRFHLDIRETVQPSFMAQIIIDNLVLSYSLILERILNNFKYQAYYETRLKYNRKALYKIMKSSSFMSFLGYENCFKIIRKVLEYFDAVVYYKAATEVIRSISTQMADFVEFVLSELTPRYDKSPADPSFNFQDKCEIEYPALIILVERTIRMKSIVKYKEVDLLRLIMERYSTIWIPEWTAEFISTALDYAKDDNHLFREILTVLVRSVPDYFVLKEYMRQYTLFALDPPHTNSLQLTMAKMAPIFRALMFIDDPEVRERYLDVYWLSIGMKGGQYFSGDEYHLTAMESFMRDSKYSFTTTPEMFENKANLLESILDSFFKIKKGNYYFLAYHCLTHNHLALYEVILKYFCTSFTSEHAEKLLNTIVFNLKLKNPIVAGAITLGYLDIEDEIDDMLQGISLDITRIKETKPQGFMRKEETSKRQRKYRVKVLENMSNMLKDCPIREMRPIVVGRRFVNVPWACPQALRVFVPLHDDPEILPKLFHYAQVILCKRFSIPIWSVSVFESTMDEAATWSETIGYMNLTIETMAKFLGYSKEILLFKFIDGDN